MSISVTATDLEALNMMEDIGGHFASNLAKAWKYADEANQERLKNAFGHLLENYREQATRNKTRRMPF